MIISPHGRQFLGHSERGQSKPSSWTTPACSVIPDIPALTGLRAVPELTTVCVGVYTDQRGAAPDFIGQSFVSRKTAASPKAAVWKAAYPISSPWFMSLREWVDILYRARLDQSDFDFSRNEIEATFGKPLLSFSTRYSFFERKATANSRIARKYCTTFRRGLPNTGAEAFPVSRTLTKAANF